mmetsp:Transcript_11040/g.38948  ORF Transcript_11040/g.38948 Transcript_11040/m.38948 type:complete len:1066 (+) Transcript_11040:124-3321(+)
MCKEEHAPNTLLPYMAFGRMTDCAALATFSAPGLDACERKNLDKAFRKLLGSADQKLAPGRQLERANDEGRICCSRSTGDGVYLSLVYVASLEYPEELGFRLSEEALVLGVARASEEDVEDAGFEVDLLTRFEGLSAKYDKLGRGVVDMPVVELEAKGPAASEPASPKEHADAEEEEEKVAKEATIVEPTIFRAGHLSMRKRKGAELRFFRLLEDRLEYFKFEEDAIRGDEPRGVLVMADVVGMDAFGDSLVIRLESNELVLSAAERDDLAAWAAQFASLLDRCGTGVLIRADTSSQDEGPPDEEEVQLADEEQGQAVEQEEEGEAVEEEKEEDQEEEVEGEDPQNCQERPREEQGEEEDEAEAVEAEAEAEDEQSAEEEAADEEETSENNGPPVEETDTMGRSLSTERRLAVTDTSTRQDEQEEGVSVPLCSGQFTIERGANKKQSVRYFALHEDRLLYFRTAQDFQAMAEPAGAMVTGDIEDVEVSDTGFFIRMHSGAEFTLRVTYKDGVAGADLEEWHAALAKVFGGEDSEGAAWLTKPEEEEKAEEEKMEDYMVVKEKPLHSGNLSVLRRGRREVQYFLFYPGRIEHYADAGGASVGLCLGRVEADDVRQVRVNNDGFSLVMDRKSMELQLVDAGSDLEVWLAALRKVLGCDGASDVPPRAPSEREDEEREEEERPVRDELEDTQQEQVQEAGAAAEMDEATALAEEEEDGSEYKIVEGGKRTHKRLEYCADQQGHEVSDAASTATAESTEAPDFGAPRARGGPLEGPPASGLRPPTAGLKPREPFIIDGFLNVSHAGKLSMKYCRLFRERLEFWTRQDGALKGAKPDCMVSLQDFYGLETVGTGFLLKHRSGHKTGINVGDNGSLREWCNALLSLLSSGEASCPSTGGRRPSAARAAVAPPSASGNRPSARRPSLGRAAPGGGHRRRPSADLGRSGGAEAGACARSSSVPSLSRQRPRSASLSGPGRCPTAAPPTALAPKRRGVVDCIAKEPCLLARPEGLVPPAASHRARSTPLTDSVPAAAAARQKGMGLTASGRLSARLSMEGESMLRQPGFSSRRP